MRERETERETERQREKERDRRAGSTWTNEQEALMRCRSLCVAQRRALMCKMT